jgi:hypothetical protein
MSCQFPAICKVVARPVEKHLFSVNAVRKLRRAVFGGIPRLLPSGVPVLSAYATKIGRSLLLAILLADDIDELQPLMKVAHDCAVLRDPASLWGDAIERAG